jgi:hypothetical protein
MLSKYLNQLSHDFISLSFLTFLILYLLYIIVIRIHLYIYKQKHNSKPVHYKNFRLYSQSLISNSPSKKEKKFYVQTNKITFFFNFLLVTSCIIYIFMCFT